MMRANGFTRNRATSRAACALAYGGSANATSYCPGGSCSAYLRASTRWTTVPSSTLRSVMLALSDDNASRWISTKSALPAPRDSASRPPRPRRRRAPSPLAAPQRERAAQPLREPVVGDRVGPLERDGGDHPRRVVQGEAQVVRPDAPCADRAGLAHAEDRRGIARTARLEIADQLLQLVAHEAQRQLQVHPLGGHQVVGAQKLARDGEKRNTERGVALPPDGEPRRHGVAPVLLEMVPDPMQRGVEIEARDAPTRAPPHIAPLFPGDEKRGPPVALHQPRRDDPDHPRPPR